MSPSNKRFDTVSLSGGTCLIVEQSKDGTYYRPLTRSNKCFNMIDKMWKQEMLCDVTLVADHTEVQAHKLILAASSIFFYTIFSRITAQKSIMVDDEDRIILDGIHYDALTTIIRYFYTAELYITTLNVKYLVKAAKLFVLNDVFNACCHFMKSQLNTSNCWDIAAFAREYDCSELVSLTNAFIVEHFTEVNESEDFLNLPKQELFELMENDKLNTTDEMNIFTSLITWIRYSTESRHQYLASLMKFVNFQRISLKNLIENVQDEPLIDNNLVCRTYVKEAMKYHLKKDGQTSKILSSVPMPKPIELTKVSTIIQTSTTSTPMPSKCPTPTATSSAIVAKPKTPLNRLNKTLVAVGLDMYYRLSMQRYHPEQQRFSNDSRSFVQDWREGSSLLITEKKVFMIGGVHIHDNRKVDIFDFTLNNWSQGRCMLEGRSCPAAAIYNGDIYVSGGLANGNYLKKCEKFDQKMGQWMKFGNMIHERSSHAMCTIDGKIYAVGGWNSTQILSSVEYYSPKKGNWTRIHDMSTRRRCPGVVAYDHKLYVLGGNDGSNFLKSVEVFDPITNNWTRLADMNFERFGAGVAARKSHIYVIGGYDGKKELDTVEVYNVKSDTWTILPERMSQSCSPAYAAYIS